MAGGEPGQGVDRVGEHRVSSHDGELGGGGRLLDWVTTTNHKTIGQLYIGGSLVFFLAGGLMAMLMRSELATPSLSLWRRAVTSPKMPSNLSMWNMLRWVR